MSYIVEYATKSISMLPKLEKINKNCFQTKLRLENSFFIQKPQGNYF